MNNYSFLSSDSNPNGQPTMQSNMQPRVPPSPSPSQNGQYNANGAQQNSIPVGNNLPSGGQQTDINYVWAVVQQLSAELERKTQETQALLNGVNALRAKTAEEGGVGAGGPVNGVGNGGVRSAPVNGESDTHPRPEFTHLQNELARVQSELKHSQSDVGILNELLKDYEKALMQLLDKLRPYAYSQTTQILALHKHYQRLLEEERGVSMQLRLEHAEWQAGLGRVAEYARGALEAKSEGEASLFREIRELREENRVLRRLAGWEEREGDEEEAGKA